MTTVERLDTGLNIRRVKHGPITWLDVFSPGTAEMEYLRQAYQFHPLALEDCLSRVQLPKLDDYDDYLFLILQFPRFRSETRLIRPVDVDFFVSGDYVVTVHSGELRPLAKLFSDCESSEVVRNDVMGHNTGALFYRILADLVAYMFPVLTKIIQLVDELEADILGRSSAVTLSRRLSIIRREVLSYRRIMRPQIAVMEMLESKEYPFLKVDPDVYFGDLADSMRRIRTELDDLREVVDGLNDTHLSLTSQQTNQVMRTLTIIATIMLPLSVVSGIYGMNVRLPLEDDRYSFGLVLGIMGLIAGGMLVFFRSRRWL